MTPTEPTKSSFLSLRVRPWGLITSAGIVAGAATLLGFLGSWSWAFDLCAHFRVQYFLGLTAVAILLLIPRQRKAAAIFGVLALVSGPPCAMFPAWLRTQRL